LAGDRFGVFTRTECQYDGVLVDILVSINWKINALDQV
jgi:hypothetical protein